VPEEEPAAFIRPNLPIRDPRPKKPGELSVQTPAKYGLVINHKTAKALGVTIMAALLARADEVIE
jgi:putative ABC transport system substrate-binding protein